MYKDLLNKAAQLLLPFNCKVVFLADRGFADTALMAHLTKLGWHWRIRLKGSFWIYRRGRRRCKVGRVTPAVGQALFWHNVFITAQQYGPVHLAIARHPQSKEFWIVVSSEPTSMVTFEEYGVRFDIEENFLDDKSNGFQLEASLIRSADALSRLFCAGNNHPLPGLARNSRSRTGQTTSGRPTLVSWKQLPQNRLELGQACSEQGIRLDNQIALIRRS